MATIAIQNNGSVITAPSGWTNLTDKQADGGLTQDTYWKIVAAGDAGTSVSWSYTKTSSSSGGITAYSNVHGAAPIDVSAANSTVSSSTLTAPSVTTTVANDLIVAAYSIVGTNATTLPGTLASVYEVNVATTPDTTNGQAPMTVAGATGTFVATATTAGDNVGTTIAIRPGP